MRTNNGGSLTNGRGLTLIPLPPTSRSTPAVHRFLPKQTQEPARSYALLSEGQHTFRIDTPRPTHDWRWAAAPSNPASERN